MNTIQQIFVDHKDEYLATAKYICPEQYKVINAICRCRTPRSGVHLFICPDCHETHIANSSCGNRHCPVCQNDKAASWVYHQQMKQLGCKYFLTTFTIPWEFHGLARRFPKQVYKALFDASSRSIKALKRDKRFVGCEMTGFTGILHTWGRQMQYHPHIHYIIPGGGLNKERTRWVEPRGDFLVHVRALSKIFKGQLYSALEEADLLKFAQSSCWSKKWVVHCKYVGNGQRVLKYLGAYVYRVAMSNARITAYDGENVTFKYNKVGSRKTRYVTLSAIEFISRFLQHVLPCGFMKVRHYGFLSGSCRLSLKTIHKMIEDYVGALIKLIAPDPPEKTNPLLCDKCKTVMQWIEFIPYKDMLSP